jgi:hypothetical protein
LASYHVSRLSVASRSPRAMNQQMCRFAPAEKTRLFVFVVFICATATAPRAES